MLSVVVEEGIFVVVLFLGLLTELCSYSCHADPTDSEISRFPLVSRPREDFKTGHEYKRKQERSKQVDVTDGLYL